MMTVASRIGCRRWGIGALLGIGVLINYIDRVNLTAEGPLIQKELNLGPADMGLLFSAFFWSYALMQIPTGILLDRFGVKHIGRLGTFLWGVASLALVFAGNYTFNLGSIGFTVSVFWYIVVARILLGIAEAPSFPVSSKATGYWFPRKERSLATAMFDAAAKFSNVIGVPLVAYIATEWGWRAGFLATTVLSFMYFLVFTIIYRDPSEDKSVSADELDYIRQGGATPEGPAPAGAGSMFGYLIGNRKVWGLTIGFAAYGYSFYLFLNWLPSYFAKTMGVNIMQSAQYSMIPWLCATFCGLVFGGWVVDKLISKGYEETKVRKTVLVIGMLFGLAVFGASQTTNLYWAIFWISIALSGLATAAPIGWSIPSLIAPRGGTGSIGGIMNFVNNLMGAAAPLITGYIVSGTDSFAPAFAVAGVVLVIGIISYIFVLGRIEPIPEPDAASDAVGVKLSHGRSL